MAAPLLHRGHRATRCGPSSAIVRKDWGYVADQAPVDPSGGRATARPTPQAALQDFDGISYAKGAAVLRQLVAYLGDDAFLAGVGDYLRQHSYGNGTLADFMGFMEQASGQSLGDWSRAWLLTAGVDVISVDRGDGRRASAPCRRSSRPTGRTRWTSPGSPVASRCSGCR